MPNKDKDPWKGGSNEGPPDIIDFFKKIFKKKPSGFNKNKQDKPPLSAKWLMLVPVLMILLWAGSGLYVVQAQEKAIVTRFGAYQSTQTPGLHWIPALIDEEQRVNVKQNYHINVQARQMLTIDKLQGTSGQKKKTENPTPNSDNGKNNQLTSNTLVVSKADQDPEQGKTSISNIGIVVADITVNYNIIDPKLFLFNVTDPRSLLTYSTISALRQAVSSMDVNNVISSERGVLQEKVRQKVTELMNRYQTGINIRSVTIQKTTVPPEVEQAYNDVVNAQADMRRFISEGRIYQTERDEIVGGITQCLNNKATAYQQQIINKAKGDVARFQAVLDSYEGKSNGSSDVNILNNIKNVTKQRLYFDAMQKALSETTNVIMDNSSNNMMYLPLDKILREENAAGNKGVDNATQQPDHRAEGPQSDLAYCENTVKTQYNSAKNTDQNDSETVPIPQSAQNNQGRGVYGS